MTDRMAEVSPETRETGRNSGAVVVSPPFTEQSVVTKGRRYYAAVLNRMGVSGTGAAVAAKLDLSEATISRAKEELERGCGVIAAIGLKIVPEEKVCVDPGEIKFLRGLYDRVKGQAPWILDAGDE
jgi:hypothetical protein